MKPTDAMPGKPSISITWEDLEGHVHTPNPQTGKEEIITKKEWKKRLGVLLRKEKELMKRILEDD